MTCNALSTLMHKGRRGRKERHLRLRASSEEGKPSAGARSSREESPEEAAERARRLLDTIIVDMNKELFGHEFYAEKFNTGAKIDQKDALKSTVRRHIHEIDGALLSCLDAILASDGIREEPEMARLLIAIRDEVLEAASEQMSPEFRVVDVISKAGGQTERKEIAHAAATGGGVVANMEVPSCKPEAALGAAKSLIEDMESQTRVYAWGMLARLVCAREALREEAADMTEGGPMGKIVSSHFPQSSVMSEDMALVQGLFQLGQGEERRGRIRQAFEKARRGEVESAGSGEPLGENPSLFKRTGQTLRAGGGWSKPKVSASQLMEEQLAEASMRPGRFVDAVRNLQLEMAAGKSTSAVSLDAVNAILSDCLAVLEDMGSELE